MAALARWKAVLPIVIGYLDAIGELRVSSCLLLCA
jgi:hypothetical protein